MGIGQLEQWVNEGICMCRLREKFLPLQELCPSHVVHDIHFSGLTVPSVTEIEEITNN
jgi:hypothetical protein